MNTAVKAWAVIATIGLLLCPLRANPESPPDQQIDIKDIPQHSKKPKAIKREAPVYPAGMARAGVIGAVVISFVIDTQGNVPNAYVVESNNPWFERAALDAVMKWKFEPAEVNGKPVNTRVRQRIEFNVDGGRPVNFWSVTKGKDHDKQPAAFQWYNAPVPKQTRFPVYPYELLQAGTPGRARISYVVGPDGSVVMSQVQEATSPEFGQAVLAMIDGWRFTPATKKDGTPCYARLGGEYEFRPNGKADVPVSAEAREILRDLEKTPASIATLGELDQSPKPLSRRPPVYPTVLLKEGRPADVMIEFFLDRNGDAQLPRIISSTAPEFGYAAVQAVATWRFEAPKKGGKPVVVRARIPVNFSITSEPPPTPR